MSTLAHRAVSARGRHRICKLRFHSDTSTNPAASALVSLRGTTPKVNENKHKTHHWPSRAGCSTADVLFELHVVEKLRLTTLLLGVCRCGRGTAQLQQTRVTQRSALSTDKNWSHERRLDSKSIGYLLRICVIRTRHVRTARRGCCRNSKREGRRNASR